MAARIFVIDGDENLLILIEASLSVQGYEVTALSNGKEAFRRIRQEKPDLVLLDTALPEMSGYQIVQKLRTEDMEVRQIPVIVMAEKPQMEELFGVADIHCFMTKPLHPPEMLRQIRRALAGIPATSSGHVGRTVLGIGLPVSLLEPLSAHLQRQGITLLAGDEGFSHRVSQIKPLYIMAPYEDSPSGGMAGTISKMLRGSGATQNLPFVVVCPDQFRDAAIRELASETLVFYSDSASLCAKLDTVTKQLV